MICGESLKQRGIGNRSGNIDCVGVIVVAAGDALWRGLRAIAQQLHSAPQGASPALTGDDGYLLRRGCELA